MRLLPIGQAAVATIVASAAMMAQAQSQPKLPTELVSVIRQTHVAIAHKDWNAPRSLMVPEFTWSFGGDGSASQAIESWQADPSVRRELRRALESKCGYVTSAVVQFRSRRNWLGELASSMAGAAGVWSILSLATDTIFALTLGVA